MCGAGTIPIEAALAALGRAPGAARGFAFESWPACAGVPVAAAAAKMIDRPTPPIVAGDREAGALDLARRNAARAAVDAHVSFSLADAATLALPERPGLIVVNPPYGARLTAGPANAAYRALATLLRRARGWRLAVLAPAPVVQQIAAGLRPRASYPLENGGIRVQLALFGPLA